MIKKLLLSAVFAIGVFSPVFVFAQATSVSTQCWTKEQCIAIRKDLVADATEAEAGFYGATTPEREAEITRVCGGVKDATGREKGFCLPSSLTVTKITFGGRNNFMHMGEFIQYMYRYGVGVAGILGTVMIIFGGFQWATSGGNSSIIGSAKKKITGSIIGMLLAITSYTILNTINPALVNLRVPGVFMINSMGLPPTYCDEITDGRKVSNTPDGDFSLDPKGVVCGQKAFVDGTGNQQCEGRFCNGGTCFPVKMVDEMGAKKLINQAICDTNYEVLIRYRISGVMTNLAGFASQWFVNLSGVEDSSDGKTGWMYTQDRTPPFGNAFAEYRDLCCSGEVGKGTCKPAKKDRTFSSSNVRMYFSPKVSGQAFRDVYAYYDINNLSNSDVSLCPDGYKDGTPGGLFVHYLDSAKTSNYYAMFVAPDSADKNIIVGTLGMVYDNPNSSYFNNKLTKGYFEANINDAVLDRILNQK